MIPESLSPIANHLCQSTLFAGVAGLLTLALRRNSARVRHWVWVAASLKFLIPFSVLVTLGSYSPWRTVVVPAPASFSTVMDQVSQPFTATTTSSPLSATVPLAPNRVSMVLFGIWVCGFVGVSISCWMRWRRVAAAARAGSSVHLGLPVRAISSPSFLEPGVFGVFRPILLLPEGIFEHLSPDQWKSIVAHELCHVRHRDNLVGAAQMFIEAVFWFHPLVWWIGKRILEQRERACDEEVLRLGNEPRTYAQGILKVCEFYLESPAVCVAGVSGSNLRKRIDAIIGNRIVHNLTSGKKLLLGSAGMLALALPIAVGVMNAPVIRAQSQPPTVVPRFEVASVKSNTSPGPTTRKIEHGSLTYVNITLGEYIQLAYGVQPFQLSGPNWLYSERFDIQAKADESASSESVKLMLQDLLTDRFNLALHRERKEFQVYGLVVGKGGPKLTPTNGGHPQGTRFLSATGYAFRNSQMSDLAKVVSTMPSLGRPALDGTGLTGFYDFELKFLDQLRIDSQAGPEVNKSSLLSLLDASLFQALGELGLKLESQRATLDVLVIEHLNKTPSEN